MIKTKKQLVSVFSMLNAWKSARNLSRHILCTLHPLASCNVILGHTKYIDWKWFSVPHLLPDKRVVFAWLTKTYPEDRTRILSSNPISSHLLLPGLTKHTVVMPFAHCFEAHIITTVSDWTCARPTRCDPHILSIWNNEVSHPTIGT